MEQVRNCPVQVCPAETVGAGKNVLDAPWATVTLSRMQEAVPPEDEQVLAVVVHGPHVGAVAPAAHDDVRVCVIFPVWPARHASVWAWEESGVQVALGMMGIVVVATGTVVETAMSAASFSCSIFTCARRVWMRDAVDVFVGCEETEVVFVDEDVGVHASPIAALVFGPTAP